MEQDDQNVQDAFVTLTHVRGVDEMENSEKSSSSSVIDDTQSYSFSTRDLSAEETAKLQQDKNLVSQFKQNKLEIEAQKNWDLFYKRNSTKFFKDRHWTSREFADILSDHVTTVS